MSRNRGHTACACGLWDLQTDHGTAAVDDPALLKQADYWSPRYYTEPMGYGFREGLSGNVYGYRSADGPRSSNAPFPGGERVLWWTYAVPNRQDRYRWKHIQCPLCRRHYAGWYVQQPASLEPPIYELYDTSFFFAANDEPGKEDEKDLVEWTPSMLVEAAREYMARRR